MQTLTVDPEPFPPWTIFVMWFQSTLIAGGLWLAWLS